MGTGGGGAPPDEEGGVGMAPQSRWAAATAAATSSLKKQNTAVEKHKDLRLDCLSRILHLDIKLWSESAVAAKGEVALAYITYTLVIVARNMLA